jgi:TolB-like protein
MDTPASREIFLFEGFQLDRADGRLFRENGSHDGESLALGSRAATLLGLLVERHGKLVTKDEILATVWPGMAVEEANLTVQISTLRRILDRERRQRESCIQTIPGRGYRLVTAVTRVAGTDRPETFACASEKPSIAVLPFINLSGDLEQEYFADGIAEDIITGLSRYPSLFVIARNSSFAYKGRAVDVKQVGGELGARYVVEGSLRKSGNRVRVTAQLVDAELGKHIWAERYDRELADLFAVQDDITVATITAIAPAIAVAERQRAMRMPPGSLDAWAAYQRGLWDFYKISPQDNALAQKYFQHAIDIDPNFAAGYKGLAWVHIQAAYTGRVHCPRPATRLKHWPVERSRSIPPMRKPIQPFRRRCCTRAAIMRAPWPRPK